LKCPSLYIKAFSQCVRKRFLEEFDRRFDGYYKNNNNKNNKIILKIIKPKKIIRIVIP